MTARIPFVLFCAIWLTGCLNSSTVIRVKPDASGTIEQTLMFSAEGIEQAFAGMGLKPTGESKTTRTSNPIDAVDLEKDIGRFGDGVSLISITPVKAAGGFEGVTVKLAFTDIARLRTDDFLTPGPAASEKKKGGAGAQDRVGFAMTRGPNGTSILTATFDETPGASVPADTPKAPKGGLDMDDPQAREMLKAMFKGFRIGMDLEVIGQLVRTNADYVQGNRITLAEVDVEQLLRESKQLETLEQVLTPDASIAKIRPYLKDIKGFKINHATVTVEFK